MHRLRQAYRALFFGEGVFAERIDAVEREFADDPLVQKIVAFIRAGGKRPLMQPRAAGDGRRMTPKPMDLTRRARTLRPHVSRRSAGDHLRRRQLSRRRRRGDRAARPPAGDVCACRAGPTQGGRALCASLDRDRAGGRLLPARPRRALPRGAVHRHAAAAAAHADPARLADDPADAAHHPVFSRRRRPAAFRRRQRCSRRAACASSASHEVAPEIIVPEGVLGRYQPSARDRADIARALRSHRALGPVRCRSGRGRCRQQRARGRSGGRDRQHAGARRRVAPAGPRDDTAGRWRSGESAKARSGSAVSICRRSVREPSTTPPAPALPAWPLPPAARSSPKSPKSSPPPTVPKFSSSG